ncbi:hypothetical protein BAUCODRAFT_148932 [Baudoinia panamericana UAMH 10762]|uniref:cyclin-dependent kinase n=1 Tax=Baudoinia panamericana (strain UAMH 10762) TaxID=717646 RepID=M2NAE2_BAUPA|nr:uncharacterized protein BAUCODRAFT_148932 [Baudoinia panamericana UAMH 10762]EMC96099.1 hypothetical protein BAUCODRAFT_148932 [Baudoinia panamericana UAMH 10762]
MAVNWRGDLGFSDRLAATAKMQVTYRIANPDCSSTEPSRNAKLLEEKARQNALSLREYHELCAKAVQLLLSAQAAGNVEDRHVDEHIFPNLPLSGAQIGRYANAQHHSDGLFSEVFKAVDPEARSHHSRYELVALKITVPDQMTPPHDSKKEARILVAANGEHIITLLEAFQQAGGRFVLVFPFLPHGLDALLRQGTLTGDSRRNILRDIFSGLAHIHNLGIIHRDIKPTNILLSSPTGPAFLIDFGIAWSPSDPASEPTIEKILDVGTTSYRPPELLFGHQAYENKLDMWAAGCVAAQVACLGSKTLFDAGDLGSELALIKSIFETLGTPDLAVWPEAAAFPDWAKMNFTQYPARQWPAILPETDGTAVDLVSKLVVYESHQRLTAEEALEHPYLKRASKGQINA